MSKKTRQNKTQNGLSYSAFFTDDNEYCFQDSTSKIFVNPTKIFTSTFKSMDGIPLMNDRDAIIRHHHFVLYSYFGDPASNKYIAMLDKSEWTFWFIHVITEIRKLQTSPKWKRDGNLDPNYYMWLGICLEIYKSALRLKFSQKESSFEVPRDFYYALTGCIDAVSPRLPHREFVRKFTHICSLILVVDSGDCAMLKMMEKSGLLVQFLRCSTMPLDDMHNVHIFYSNLMNQLSFIQKKFKTGQPCNDIAQKILAGDDGYSNPDPKVLNFLRTILQLAEKARASQLDDQPKNAPPQKKICHFCKTTKSDDLMKLCSQCRITHYCSKECQRNDWKSHKQYCEQNSGLKVKNIDKYENMVKTFLTDHSNELQAKVDKTISETGLKQKELVLVLDFAPDESGVAPALSNPPRFEILRVKNAHEYFLHNKYPDALADNINGLLETLMEHQMFCVWRSTLRVRLMII